MPHLTVHVARHLDIYRVAVHIDGQVEPTTVFGCREALAPVVRALLATEDEQHRLFADAEPDAARRPSTIAFHLPGARVVTFAAILPQERTSTEVERLS